MSDYLGIEKALAALPEPSEQPNPLAPRLPRCGWGFCCGKAALLPFTTRLGRQVRLCLDHHRLATGQRRAVERAISKTTSGRCAQEPAAPEPTS